jgi:hypothetical protein
VHVSANQTFTEYYNHIYHTNALLLYLSSKSYITDRCALCAELSRAEQR